MGHLTLSESRKERGQKSIRVIAVNGDLDADTFRRLQDRLEQMIVEGEKTIVLDCSHLGYISSAGLGVLMKIVKEIRKTGGDLSLAHLSEKIHNIVNVLGFSKVIQVFSTVEEAVSSY
jgi:anti-sigma B factor antagonist